MKYRPAFLFIICLVIAIGCGADPEEKREDAIYDANRALTLGNCDKAISLLEAVGRDNKNSVYLQTLASAYACKSGLREPSFFENDLPNTASPAPLGGTGRYANSSGMVNDNDASLSALYTAIDLLLFAGGISTSESPSVTKRASYFTSSETANINSQLLYMLLSAAGRFFYYYGNSDSAGQKGQGTGIDANTCFVDYSENVTLDNVYADLNAYFAGAGPIGSCAGAGSGHSSFGASGSRNISRLCRGVVLINNLFDVIPEVLAASTGTDFSAVSATTTTITTLRTAVAAAKNGMSNILDVKSYDLCVSENTSNDDYIQVYYAFIVEALFL